MIFGIMILAAGRSDRMGTLKCLLRAGQQTLFEHILHNPILLPPFIRPIVVLGHQAEHVLNVIDFHVPVTTNLIYAEGRTTSIQCGLRAIRETTDGIFIWPVDCPFIPERVFEQLMDSFQNRDSICIPSIHNRRGHPPLIGASYYPIIMNLRGDQTLRDLYGQYPEAVHHVPVSSDAILDNCNTPEQFEIIKAKYGFSSEKEKGQS